MGRYLLGGLVFLSAVFAGLSPARAVDVPLGLGFSVDARLIAGLDAPTRDLINGLPSEIRVQLIKTLEEALPMIDESVNGYLNKVDQIIGEQITHGSCAIQGATKGMVQSVKSLFSFSGSAQPIKALRKEKVELETRFSRFSKPEDYMIAYGDFLANATATSCEVDQSPEAAATTARLSDDIRTKWLAWNFVYGGCASAFECAGYATRLVQQEIGESDPRDVEDTRAFGLIQQVSVPAKPGFFASFVPGDYEEPMVQAFKIARALELARFKRNLRSATLLGEVQKAQKTENEGIAAGVAAVYKADAVYCDFVGARDSASAIKTQVDGDLSKVANALTVSTMFRDVAGDLQTAAADLKKRAGDLETFASNRAQAVPVVRTTSSILHDIQQRVGCNMLH